MKARIYRFRFVLFVLAAFSAVYLIGELSDYLRHGGLNTWANDCISRADGTATNTCEETINFAVCIRGFQREKVVPCYQIGAIAPGSAKTLRPAPADVQTVFLACRAPYQPTRAPRQESSLRFGYACGPGTVGLRLTE